MRCPIGWQALDTWIKVKHTETGRIINAMLIDRGEDLYGLFVKIMIGVPVELRPNLDGRVFYGEAGTKGFILSAHKTGKREVQYIRTVAEVKADCEFDIQLQRMGIRS